MKIQEIKEQDAAEIAEMTKKEFPYTGFSAEKLLLRKKEGAMIFKATEGKTILGFIDFEFLGENAKISGLSVKKEFRGKKIGKSLMMFAVNFLSLIGAKKINLLVKEENSTAKKIYESLGFYENGNYPKKIDNTTVVKMELKLNKNRLH